MDTVAEIFAKSLKDIELIMALTLSHGLLGIIRNLLKIKNEQTKEVIDV